MLCFIALIIFGILGISSAYYRQLAKEAWQCVGKKIRLKPCDTGLDSKIKAEVMQLFASAPRAGNVVYHHFELIAWIIVLFSILLTGYLAYGGYNYYYYGNCNGPNDQSFCLFDPFGNNKYSSAGFDAVYTPESLILPFPAELVTYPARGQENSSVTVIEFGCFTCPFTKASAPAVEQLWTEYENKIRFVYVNVPLPQHTFSENAFASAWCVQQQNPDFFWDFYKNMFNETFVNNESIQSVTQQLINEQNLNLSRYEECITSHEYDKYIKQSRMLANNTRIYGTPTFFINNQRLVGPKQYDELQEVVEDELS